MYANYESAFRAMCSRQKALFAFNIQNIYHLIALDRVARELDAPVIAQVSAKHISSLDENYGLVRLVEKFQRGYVFFHLDHCVDETIISHCVDCGFAGVMFDGSRLPLGENIRRTNEFYRICSRRGTLLEVEVGAIAGVEDGFGDARGGYFSIRELEVFCAEARFDLLAVAIGNAHGEYTTTKSIRIELLRDARQQAGIIPLVLHGGTSLPDEMILQAISFGVAKVNISTGLKIATRQAIDRYAKTVSSHDECLFAEVIVDECASFFRPFISKFTA